MSGIEQYVAAMLDFARDARDDDGDGLPLVGIFAVETYFLGEPLE